MLTVKDSNSNRGQSSNIELKDNNTLFAVFLLKCTGIKVENDKSTAEVPAVENLH